MLPLSLNCTCVLAPAAAAAPTVAFTQALPFHCNNCPLDVPEIVVSAKAPKLAAAILVSALASALALVKYKFVPSLRSAVS